MQNLFVNTKRRLCNKGAVEIAEHRLTDWQSLPALACRNRSRRSWVFPPLRFKVFRMSIAAELKQVAEELAQRFRSRLPALHQEEAQIDARKAGIQAEREAIGTATQRAVDFQPQIETEFLCPCCWIEQQRRFALMPLPGDVWRCDACGFEHTFK